MARQKVAAQYNEGLKTLTNLLETPCHIPNSTHVYNQYTLKIKHNRRDDLQKYLKEKGVPTMVYYPLSLQQQPAFCHCGLDRQSPIIRIGSDLSETEQLCQSVLSLPMHTELDEEQIRYIIEQIMKYE